jgi:hypothetical protein
MTGKGLKVLILEIEPHGRRDCRRLETLHRRYRSINNRFANVRRFFIMLSLAAAIFG